MSRPKVLFATSLYSPVGVGGAERVVQVIAESVAAEGIDSVVVTLTPERSGRTDVLNGVIVHRIPIPNFYWPFGRDGHGAVPRSLWHVRDAYNPQAASAFDDVLIAEAPDVVNTHNIAGFSVSIWRQVVDRDIPLVHTMHDQYLLCPRSTMYRNGRNCVTPCRSCRLYTWPRRRVAELPDLVTGPSRFILDRHVEHGWFVDTPHRVIRNARAPHTDSSTRTATEGDAPFRFGFLGRLTEAKGLEPLLRAFSALPPGTAELLIAGTGDEHYERHVRALAADAAGIRWLGFVDTSILLDEIDVLVVPSTWDDTAPLVVMEAFERGRPVLGSDRGGIPELVELGAGWIFDPDDHHRFVEHLLDCVGHRRRLDELGDICRRAASSFTAASMVGDYLAAYRVSGARQF